MGPILPQINVFGKELGVSPDVMGFIMSFLPILYVLAKPSVGFLIDYFPVSIWSTLKIIILILKHNFHDKNHSLRNKFVSNLVVFIFFPTVEHSKNDIHYDCFHNDFMLCWFLFRSKYSRSEHSKAVII